MTNIEWTILKFGGSSISKLGFESIIRRINQILNTNENNKIVIVLSAIKNATNLLLKNDLKNAIDINLKLVDDLGLDKDVINKLSLLTNNYKNKRELVSLGEILSTNIFYEYVTKNNILDAELLDSKEFMKALNEYDNNEELYLSSEYYADYDCFSKLISNKKVYICQGFIASTLNKKDVCLIGRGGSDTSASLIANMLNAESIEIWTDVNGMYTSDPNKIKNSRIINEIGYYTFSVLMT